MENARKCACDILQKLILAVAIAHIAVLAVPACLCFGVIVGIWGVAEAAMAGLDRLKRPRKRKN